MEHETIETTKPEIKNKRKTINVVFGKDEKYSINFINEGSKLSIIAKTSSDIISLIYSNKFSLEDIKKTRFFIDFESIDECLAQIFLNLDKNETQIEKINDSTINIKIPLYNIRNPFIQFPLMKREKNENEKYSELLNIVVNMKKKHDEEIQLLTNEINFLKNALKARNNKDYKKDLDSFKGSVIEMTCFGRNDIDNYFDLNQDYALGENNERNTFFSLVFKCKNNNEIPLVVDAFNKIKHQYPNSKNIFTRVKNNKLYVEIEMSDFFQKDMFIIQYIALNIFSGQSIIIKTEATPRDMFEEYYEEKMLKFILDTEVDFSYIAPQLLIISIFLFFSFGDNNDNDNLSEALRDIIQDINVNLLDGNYKYKVKKYLLYPEKEDQLNNNFNNNFNNQQFHVELPNNNNNCNQQDLRTAVEKFHDFLRNIILEFTCEILQIEKFKEYKKINFDEIELNLITTKYKAGFNFKIKVPKTNELVEDIISGKIEKIKK